MTSSSQNSLESQESQKDVKNDDENYVPLWSFKSTRFWMSFILLYVVFCSLNMRTNIGISMVCMVNSTASKGTQILPESIEPKNNETVPPKNGCQKPKDYSAQDMGYSGSFLWDSEMQGWIISSTGYGSLVTMLFSGYIADVYGPRLVCLLALVLYTIITLLAPFLSNLNYFAFLASRIVMGLADGCVLPAIAAIIVKWYPAAERSTIAAIYTSGNQIGASIGTYVSAKLCLVTFLGGWPLIFYIYDFQSKKIFLCILGIICIILWGLLATNSADECKFMSEKEKRYLEKELNAGVVAASANRRRLTVPWKRLLTSPATWSVFITRFSFMWMMTVMQMLLPSFLRDVMFLDMNTNGLYTALPFVVMFFSKNFLAVLSDYLKRNKILGMTASTKIMQTIASFGSAIGILGLAFFVDCSSHALAIVFLLIFGLSFGGMVSGGFTASLLIAPEFSGIIESISGFLGMIAYILSGVISGFINQTGSSSEWAITFGICAFYGIFSGIVFLIWGSADVQTWSKFSNASLYPPKLSQIYPTKPHDNDNTPKDLDP